MYWIERETIMKMWPHRNLELADKILKDIDEFLGEVRMYKEEHVTVYAAVDVIKQYRAELQEKVDWHDNRDNTPS